MLNRKRILFLAFTSLALIISGCSASTKRLPLTSESQAEIDLKAIESPESSANRLPAQSYENPEDQKILNMFKERTLIIDSFHVIKESFSGKMLGEFKGLFFGSCEKMGPNVWYNRIDFGSVQFAIFTEGNVCFPIDPNFNSMSILPKVENKQLKMNVRVGQWVGYVPGFLSGPLPKEDRLRLVALDQFLTTCEFYENPFYKLGFGYLTCKDEAGSWVKIRVL